MNLTPSDALSGVVRSTVDTAQGKVQFRSAGMAPKVTHVLLHGIGSASASWAFQLGAAVGRSDIRVLAWEALYVNQPVVLAGHSLGALMAASATRLRPQAVSRLVLLAPARGYGDAPLAERKRVVQGRLSNLQQLGPHGMALARAAAMLSPDAAPALQEAVRETMAQIDPAGYAQAVHMLGQACLAQDLKTVACPVWVASGEADTVTTPANCNAVAQDAAAKRISLGPVGHACPLEAAEAVNELLGLPALGGLG
jgi:pimeloyl-ACP methyl ester carboxylesterase